jgi:hypothetical protein
MKIQIDDIVLAAVLAQLEHHLACRHPAFRTLSTAEAHTQFGMRTVEVWDVWAILREMYDHACLGGNNGF